MKKLVLLLFAAALAASPALAASKHKKSKEAIEVEDIAKQHDNTKRLLVELVPLVLPSWSLPIYFNMHQTRRRPTRKRSNRPSALYL